MMPSIAMMSGLGFARWAAPNKTDERASAHHRPNMLQSSRKITPRNTSSSVTPEWSEIASAFQAGAMVGPVSA